MNDSERSEMQGQNCLVPLIFGWERGELILRSPVWPALEMGPLVPGIKADGVDLVLTGQDMAQEEGKGCPLTITSHFRDSTLIQTLTSAQDGPIRLMSELVNESPRTITLQSVRLLGSNEAQGGKAVLSQAADAVRVYEQGGYWARVRSLGCAVSFGKASGEEDASQAPSCHASQAVWVAFDSAAPMALLAGFETNERWNGQIQTEEKPGQALSGWSLGFDAGDLIIDPGQRVRLEDAIFLWGPNPLALLDRYGDEVARRRPVRITGLPPVSWCSWYPYRLGVTEERVLANAQIGKERLQPLGLRIMEVDLGWERQHLPSAFEENVQFPGGLKGLSDRLESQGFVLGAWKAPFTISERDPLAKEHPDWLLGSEEQSPLPLGEWFWEPHGQTYALDCTHPGAQAWLREKMRSLAERGVRYFKPDFIGGVMHPDLRRRYDRTRVAGAGAEASRIGMKIIQEEMLAASPEALVLNCGGPDMPGTGSFPLLYTCNDTGNTGFVGWNHLREDYGRNVAGHLWKNRRWGLLQPSCLVVGLPGALEEARLRATATFLAGGQVDISDDLTVLPEDRWQVLLATLPPMGLTATPLDLFEPFDVSSLDYEGLCRGQSAPDRGVVSEGFSQVWKLSIDATWDQWDLFGLFNYACQDNVAYGQARITRFQLPLKRLGLDPDVPYWAYEFWSGQFLGQSPFSRVNPGGYRHPGDAQSLVASKDPGQWEVSFFGPSIKLLAVRKARPHPWVVGTTFHQSAGAELSHVVWEGNALRGRLNRPPGQEGGLVLCDAGRGQPIRAWIEGQPATLRQVANQGLLLPLATHKSQMSWEVQWR